MALYIFTFYAITINYRARLNSVLTVTFFPQPIDTLEELANTVSPCFIYLHYNTTYNKAQKPLYDLLCTE